MINWVRYSQKANADVRSITLYQLQYHSEKEVETIIEKMRKEIEAIATTPGIGTPVQNAMTNIRQFNVSRHRYKVYYQVMGQNSIKILRIWPTRSKPLTLVDIES